MDLQAIAFYVLSAVTIGSALMVVTARNPVHSVLFLITTFFTCAGLFVLLGAEFLAMLLIGAIVLTLRHKPGIKRQDISAQVARTADTGMRIITDVKIGQGIDA